MAIGLVGEVGGVVLGHVMEAPVVDAVHAQTQPLETVDHNVQVLPQIVDHATQIQIAQVSIFLTKIGILKCSILFDM